MGSIVDILNRVRDMLMLVIGSLSLVMLTVGGIRYVTAGGDKDGVNGAKQTVGLIDDQNVWSAMFRWQRNFYP